MTTVSHDLEHRDVSRWARWLERPLSSIWCAFGWLISSVVFIGGTQLLGGTTSGDAADSLNTTWAISHGMLACAYAPGNQYGLPFSGPLYPLISGGLASVLRIGHQVPFPTVGDFGPHCSTAISSMYYWSLGSGAQAPTITIGYVSWLALMCGMVALLRACGRGRCRWEPLALILLAVVPPVFMCLHEYFHPQDLLAMGLILGGLACVRRSSWFWAGIMFGLAFTSQQFTLLALAPLAVITPRKQLGRFAVATLTSVILVVAPLAVFTPTAAIKAVLTGSGTTWTSVTLLDLTRLAGPWLFFCSRYLPIAAAMALAWWAHDRLGTQTFEPVPLISLIATSLSLRLVFEVNLWGYYFMAVAVSVLILDIVRGRLRWSYFAWLALIALAYHPAMGVISSWGFAGTPWFPLWTWQLVLATLGVALSVVPLVECVRRRPITPVT